MPLIDNLITRLPSGLNNLDPNDIFSSLKVPDDFGSYHMFDEDFNRYAAADWTVTETQAGATQALTAGDGGLMLLTNSAANNDINQIQLVPANFSFAAGKKCFLKVRFKINDATNSAFSIGLQNANVDGTTLATATDGLFFYKPLTFTTLSVYMRQDNATGSNAAAIATLADDTYVVAAAFFDGVDRLYYAVNGTVTGYITIASTMIPDANCAPVISLKNGAAVAKNATIDYLFFAKER